MVRGLATGCLLVAMLGGCVQRAAAPAGGVSLADPKTLTNDTENTAKPPKLPPTALLAGGDTVATVNGKPITVEQLYRPMIDAYGLNFVLHLAQVEYCRQLAEAAKVQLTPQDIAVERGRLLEQMFSETLPDEEKMSPDELKAFKQKEYERLLEQFLQVRRLSRPEFDMVVMVNAYLRKLAEPGIKEQIKEEHLQQGFKILFGEKVQVRHIQLANMRELAEAQRRLNGGERFEQVAREMSIDKNSAALGGKLRPFSRAEPMWPDAFKDAAFALKEPGDVSGPVSTGDAVHLIQLMAKIPPSPAVKYEANKEYVREKIFEGLLTVRMEQLRRQMQQEAPKVLKILDPALRKQYIDRQTREAGATQQDRNVISKEIELNGSPSATTRPADASAQQPTRMAEGLRPPATRPAN
jgi:parvulin-like peptidyl-prolyl isomerase